MSKNLSDDKYLLIEALEIINLLKSQAVELYKEKTFYFYLPKVGKKLSETNGIDMPDYKNKVNIFYNCINKKILIDVKNNETGEIKKELFSNYYNRIIGLLAGMFYYSLPLDFKKEPENNSYFAKNKETTMLWKVYTFLNN